MEIDEIKRKAERDVLSRKIRSIHREIERMRSNIEEKKVVLEVLRKHLLTLTHGDD